MKCVVLLFLAVATISGKTLNYKFNVKKGKAELEVSKSDKIVKKKHSSAKLRSKVKKMSDIDMIKLNPMMAPMIELGDILKDFNKTMKQKNRHKKRKKKSKKRKLHVVKTDSAETSNSIPANQNSAQPADRKAFIGDMGMGASAALVGGGALAAGVGAGMAMGAADNEKLEHEISLKENELGIMKIREKVDDDINQELFSSNIRFRGLREKAKVVLLNGEESINQIENQMDSALGNLQAMDKHIYNTFKG